MWGIERNKDPELPMKQRNTSWFVILDDRKHGRAGKFPVFYDIDTGDYLEPPEGFLDSAYETLREWYAVHPQDDPNNDKYKEPAGMAAQPLSTENQDKSGSDLSEEDIPPADEQFLAAEQAAKDFISRGDEAQDIPVEGDTSEQRRESLAAILEQQKTDATPTDFVEDDSDWDEPPF